MKLETALQKPRTVQQLMKLTGLSRGGVLGGIKRCAKKAGKLKTDARGPASLLYVLRKGAAPAPKARVARTAPAEAVEAPQTGVQAETGPLPETVLEKQLDANEAPTEALYQAPAIENA